uniref:Uncharacterized protein n=1 Tax=Trypanosoma congolense (strain IL3000) TaxID=1068625 RepID=G0URG7_TRYCI|nr:conserved hypothetical protein [Trypanosoma congolense IL3000]
MLSWDPKSYVTEAFSRILIEEAKKDKADVVPSYYDAVTGHLESHELSKRISASIRDQKDQNSSIAFDLNNSTLEVMYNPENQEGVNLTERKIENIFHLVMDKFQRVSEELKIVHANGGKVLVSNELFHILCHIQHMCELTNYRHCFASTKGGMCLSAKESSERLASMKLKDDSTVEWPDGMTLDLSGYLEAWLVDKMLEQLETLDGLRGCLVRFKSIAHAFGVPSGGSLWKCGVLTVDIDGEEKFIGCVGLGSFRPAAVTNTVQTSTSVLSAMQHCTACCKTAVVSCCLSAVISSLIEKEGALSFIREWRVSHGPETAESLLSFTLFFGFDKPISDEEDTTIGEHDDERMLLHDRRGHIAQAYQQLEAVVLNESHVANVVLNNKNADFFHNVSVVNRTTIDCLEEAICFFPNLCVLASYVDELGTTSVTTLKAADFPRGDDTFLFCISQRSPLFNRVFAKKSQITLNFLYENAKGIYEALSTAYPLWINEGGNEPVFLERNSRTCATTKFLVDVSDQETFETSESFLVGEDVLVIGKCLDGVPNKVTTSINKMFVVNHPFPSREFYPFLFTIVHKLYGTVGFVGYGCQLCTLSPLSMLIYCPVEASSFVLDEEHTGPKCNLTFFSKAGSFIFAGKTLGELRCGMPAELSVINALPPECFFFQAEGMLVRTIRGPSNKYVICLVAISNGRFHKCDPCMLLVGSDDEPIVIP